MNEHQHSNYKTVLLLLQAEELVFDRKELGKEQPESLPIELRFFGSFDLYGCIYTRTLLFTITSRLTICIYAYIFP